MLPPHLLTTPFVCARAMPQARKIATKSQEKKKTRPILYSSFLLVYGHCSCHVGFRWNMQLF